MKLACHSTVCSEEYLHAAPLRTQKTAIEKRSLVWSVMAHVVWNTEKLSHLRFRHAIADLCESVLGYRIAENEEHCEGEAAEQQTGKHYQNLGLALHRGVMVLAD
jgi:hypothetical protein